MLAQFAEERRMSREYLSFLPGRENRAEINGSPQREVERVPLRVINVLYFSKGKIVFCLLFLFFFSREMPLALSSLHC